MAHVVGEGLAVDHRLGIVEDHRAAVCGQLAGDETRLLTQEVGFECRELVVGVDAPHDHEPVLAEEADDGIGVVGREHTDLPRQRRTDRFGHDRQATTRARCRSRPGRRA